MQRLDREGKFKARPVEWGVKQVNDRPMFEVDYQITAEFVNGEWVDWSEYEIGIQAPYWLFQTDGSVNKKPHECLKECFGWSGRSLEDLHSNDWSGIEVQLTVEWETYKNKQSLKVKWTNPGDAVIATKVSPDKLKQLDNVWGAKLRALAGPAKPPAKPAPAKGPEPLRGLTSPTTHKPAPPNEPKVNGECTMDAAWEVFCEEFKIAYPDGTDENRNKSWHAIIREVLPNKETVNFDDHDWAKVRDKAKKSVIPF